MDIVYTLHLDVKSKFQSLEEVGHAIDLLEKAAPDDSYFVTEVKKTVKNSFLNSGYRKDDLENSDVVSWLDSKDGTDTRDADQ